MALEISNPNHHAIPINRNSLQCTNERVKSSRFKGVFLLKSCKWGVRIYHNRKTYWLGSYLREEEAGAVHDRAAIKLKNIDALLNFSWANYTVQEIIFQSCFSAEEVVNMIREKTYLLRLTCFISDYFSTVGAESSSLRNHQLISRQFLFQKELTNSDVARKRFIIPKEYSLEYFSPLASINSGEEEVWNSDIILTFYDKNLLSWNFRYSYWRSSKSLLFTGGWGQFIKMYKLKPGDRVFFFRCAYAEDVGVKEFYMIDVHQNNLDFSAIGLNGEKEMDAKESSNSEGRMPI